MTESAIILADVKWHLTLYRPGYSVERKEVDSWPEINAWIVNLAGKKDYPYGSVLRIKDWTGIERYIVRGGGKEAPVLIKLSENVVGLPTNPNKPLAMPASPSLDFSLPGSSKDAE